MSSLVLLVVFAADAAPPRWVYMSHNLQVRENAQVVEKLMERAAAAGYNGVVLADFKLNILGRVPDWYFPTAERVKRTADRLKLELIPTVAPFGYSAGMLVHDPNLAEGLPVKRAEFRVVDGAAKLDSSKSQRVANGGFESANGDRAPGFGFQDGPGEVTHIDKSVFRAGKRSLRFERTKPGNDYVNARIQKPLKLRAFSQYHVSAWIKSENFEAIGETRMTAITPRGRTLSHTDVGIKPTQDWKQHHIVFNTLEDIDVGLYVGVWGLRGGKMWVDDLQIEEVAFLNMVERAECPLIVRNAAGEEMTPGKDFAPIRDDRMHELAVQGSFEVYHEPPTLKILPGGRLKEGDALTVDYWHTVSIHDQQVAASLSDPKSLELIRDQVRRVKKLFEPKRYFLAHDEIRVANWSSPDGRTGGRTLADNVAACCKIVREESPGAGLCIWSDMFDPHHNAVDNYYLVRGSYKDSWEGLPKDVLIVNWNSGKPAESLPFFAERGHAQLLAGYYDGPADAIKSWQRTAAKFPTANGVMYTTWRNNYADLEAFAKAAWGKN